MSESQYRQSCETLKYKVPNQRLDLLKSNKIKGTRALKANAGTLLVQSASDNCNLQETSLGSSKITSFQVNSLNRESRFPFAYR